MKRPKSISAGDLPKKVRVAVDQALKANTTFKDITGIGKELTYFPDPGIIGFIVRPETLRQKPFGDVHKLAGQIAGKFTSASQVAIVGRPGGIIVGFFPVDRDIILK